jgi:hypothetical protein
VAASGVAVRDATTQTFPSKRAMEGSRTRNPNHAGNPVSIMKTWMTSEIPGVSFLRSWRNTALCFIAGMFGMLLLQQASAFAPFSVQGTLTYEVPGRPVLYGHFTMGLSNSLWHVTVIQEHQTDFLSFEYNYDGANCLQYAIPAKSSSGAGSGLVETGPVPSSTSTASGEVVWLAYASGGYFHGLKAGTATSLEPLRSPHGLIRRYEMPAEWELGTSEPFFPVEISYYATNVTLLDDTGRLNLIPLDEARSPKYVAAHLRTWDPVAFQGMTIPRYFEFITYGPWPRPGTAGRKSIVQGHATNVCSLIAFPGLPTTLHLQDQRVPEPLVMYKTTNRSLPDLASVAMTNARAIGNRRFQDRVDTAGLAARAPQSARRQRLARTLILFAALAPVAIYATWRVRRARTTPKK